MQSCRDIDIHETTELPPAMVSVHFQVSTCQDEPVVGLTPGDFVLYEDEQTISEYESAATVEPDPLGFRLNALLVLDISGSVTRSGSLPALQEAASGFVEHLLGSTEGQSIRIGLYVFDGRPEIVRVVDFTSDRNSLLVGIESIGLLLEDDSTNLYGAVTRGINVLDVATAADRGIVYDTGALVLFTDGTDQAARVSRSEALSAVNSTENLVYAIGLGGEHDSETLGQIGRNGFESVSDVTQITWAFDNIAEHIATAARSHYMLQYCSPKRSGTHEIRLAMSEPNVATEGGEGAFDATGFEGGCHITGDALGTPSEGQDEAVSAGPIAGALAGVGLVFILILLAM